MPMVKQVKRQFGLILLKNLSEVHSALCSEYDEVGKMLGSMADNPEKFLPKNKTIG